MTSDVKSLEAKLKEKRRKENQVRFEEFTLAAECFYTATKLYTEVLEKQGLTGGFGLTFETRHGMYALTCKPMTPEELGG
jgi:hypothetical protein